MNQSPEPVGKLRRWETGGAGWRVVSRGAGGLRIELVTCTGDEVVEVLTSADPALAEYVGGRASNEDQEGLPGAGLSLRP